MKFNCPNCQKELNAPDSLAGRNATCRGCGTLVRIPGELGSHMPAEAAVSSGNKFMLPIIIAVTVLVLGGGAYFMMGGKKAPTTAAKTEDGTAATAGATPEANPTPQSYGALSTLPPDCMAVAAIEKPAQLIQQWLTVSQKASADNAQLAKGWQQLRQASLENLGIDFANVQDYKGIGIDLAQPLTAALLEPTLNGEPKGFVLGFGVSSSDALLALVRKVAAKKKIEVITDSSAQPAVYRVDDAAIVIDGNRGYLAAGPDKIGGPALLRGYLSKKAKQSITSSEKLINSVRGLGGVGDATLFVDLQTIVSNIKSLDKPAFVDEFRGLAVKGSGKDNGSFVSLAPQSRLRDLLKPGGECREFISRADKPLLAVTFSLSDTMGLIRGLMPIANAASFTIASQKMKAGAGISLEELGELLKDGALGITAYKSQGPLPLSVLIFAKLHTKDPAQLKRGQAGLDYCLRKLSGLPENLSGMIQSALVDEYFVCGTANDQILKLAQNKTPAWMPRYGKNEVLAIEYYFGEMAEHLKKINPAMNNPQTAMIGPGASFMFSITQRGDGFFMSSESGEDSIATLAMASAIGIPSLLRSRMAANETAAMANCKAYAEAQEIYHRTDYDNDGILEYAQAMKGNNSLLETKTGANDIMLIDTRFAAAEGPPSQNPVPKAGYCFKILKAQGANVPGGDRSFLVPDPKDKSKLNMIIGYALVAYPAVYDSTGRNTFMISHQGIIFQKDLGPQTSQLVEKMTEFNTDPTWAPAE